MRKLYDFYWDCGRGGHIEGMFVADELDVSRAIGRTVNFGEVLGKHSEIYGDLESQDFTVLTDDQGFIDKLLALKIVPRGYNPLERLEWDEEDGE